MNNIVINYQEAPTREMVSLYILFESMITVSINILNVAQVIIYFMYHYIQLRKRAKPYQRQVVSASIDRCVIIGLRNKDTN